MFSTTCSVESCARAARGARTPRGGRGCSFPWPARAARPTPLSSSASGTRPPSPGRTPRPWGPPRSTSTPSWRERRRSRCAGASSGGARCRSRCSRAGARTRSAWRDSAGASVWRGRSSSTPASTAAPAATARSWRSPGTSSRGPGTTSGARSSSTARTGRARHPAGTPASARPTRATPKPGPTTTAWARSGRRQRAGGAGAGRRPGRACGSSCRWSRWWRGRPAATACRSCRRPGCGSTGRRCRPSTTRGRPARSGTT
mmetsp:Transcript_89904/g.254784  ORF Transcript_89904/g.254784 Transcript_89904/m.254784 type:complete len:259 (+) Transcript_89904:290-1066(+)